MKKLFILILAHFMCVKMLFPQSGTFDFYIGATEDGQSISQTVSGVTLTVYSDHSTTPYPSIVLQDWSAYPPFTNNAGTMNGQAKPSCTFTFSQPVNISTILVSDFYGSTNPHLLFTANTSSTYNLTIDGYNGTVVHLNFVHITSFVITNYDGGTIDLGFDNVVMDATLPVELTSFTANISGSNVELNWQTEVEVNNYGFEIERSVATGKQQSSSLNWQKIGFVKSYGNSNSQKKYSFKDIPAGGTTFKYRLKQIDNDGNFKYSNTIEASFIVTGDFKLDQNFPNPFNPSTAILFNLPEEGRVTVRVFDIMGREVIILMNENMTAGKHKVVWEGKDNFGKDVTSGIYFYSLKFNEQSITKKMLLVR